MAEPRLLSTRAIVGLFVLVTLGILAWGTLQLGGFSFRQAEGYPLYAVLDSAYGIEPQTPILIAGIKVGEVTAIELYQKRARITMKFLRGVQIHEDASIAVKTAGILGEKYLEVDPGSEEAALLKPGDTIVTTYAPPDFERLAEQLTEISADIKAVTRSLRYAVGTPEMQQSLRSIVLSMEALTRNLNEAVIENRAGVRDTIATVNRIARMLEEQAPELLDNVNRVAVDARGFVGSVSDAVADLRPKLDDTVGDANRVVTRLDAAAADLQEITGRLNRGEGTIGKLLTDEATVNKLNDALEGVNVVLQQVRDLRTIVHYRGEYRFNETNDDRLVNRTGAGGLKSYFGLRIQPKEDKYYLFEVIDDPMGRLDHTRTIVRDPATGAIVSDRQVAEFENKIKFSAQLAKKFYGITLRGGIIQNTGGVGLDYAIVDPDLQLAVHAYDFTRDNNPNLKAELNWYFLNHFFVTAGAEDLVNRHRVPFYFAGGGLHFDDEDLKLLFSAAPPVSF